MTDERKSYEEVVADPEHRVGKIDLAAERAAEKLQPATGCWIDGHWGQWGITRLIEIAREYGFVIHEDDGLALFNYRHGDDGFIYEGQLMSASDWILSQGGLGDAAEEWLNKNVAREGFAFSWVDGEFFYMNQEWFEED